MYVYHVNDYTDVVTSSLPFSLFFSPLLLFLSAPLLPPLSPSLSFSLFPSLSPSPSGNLSQQLQVLDHLRPLNHWILFHSTSLTTLVGSEWHRQHLQV